MIRIAITPAAYAAIKKALCETARGQPWMNNTKGSAG